MWARTAGGRIGLWRRESEAAGAGERANGRSAGEAGGGCCGNSNSAPVSRGWARCLPARAFIRRRAGGHESSTRFCHRTPLRSAAVGRRHAATASKVRPTVSQDDRRRAPSSARPCQGQPGAARPAGPRRRARAARAGRRTSLSSQAAMITTRGIRYISAGHLSGL